MSSFRDNVSRNLETIQQAKTVDPEELFVELVQERLNKQFSNYCQEIVSRSAILKTYNTLKVAKKICKDKEQNV